MEKKKQTVKYQSSSLQAGSMGSVPTERSILPFILSSSFVVLVMENYGNLYLKIFKKK